MCNQSFHAGHFFAGDVTESSSEAQLEYKANGHRLAVGKREIGQGFQRPPQGVAQVQDLSEIGFVHVRGHDAGFDLAVFHRDVRRHGRIDGAAVGHCR